MSCQDQEDPGAEAPEEDPAEGREAAREWAAWEVWATGEWARHRRRCADGAAEAAACPDA